MSLKKNKIHCINVLKVFDWVMCPVELKLIKDIKERKKLITDCIFGNIVIPCGESALLWRASPALSVSGSITIFNSSGSGQMEVIVNGDTAFFISSGQSRSMTFLNLESVEVRCTNEKKFCIGKYCLNLHYLLSKMKLNRDNCELICFLSDKEGKPTDSILCKEIPQKGGRENVEILLPNKKIVILQKVKLIKKGFITTKIICSGKACFLCTIPFCIVETFLLCAPPGTSIECEIHDFTLEHRLLFNHNACDCKKIAIAIHFCQEVQVVANVNIEIAGMGCHPRPEIDAEDCIIPSLNEKC